MAYAPSKGEVSIVGNRFRVTCMSRMKSTCQALTAREMPVRDIIRDCSFYSM